MKKIATFVLNIYKKMNTAHFHPMIVHFPIAIIMIGFLADTASLIFRKEKCLSTMGFYLLITGTLAAIAAVATGYFFTSPMEGEPGLVRDRHELFAFLTLAAVILAAVFRIILVVRKKEETRLKYLAFGIFFLAFIFVSVTGYLGGILVMEYLIGI
jgi:uncharacterized membrane protein